MNNGETHTSLMLAGIQAEDVVCKGGLWVGSKHKTKHGGLGFVQFSVPRQGVSPRYYARCLQTIRIIVETQGLMGLQD